MAQTRPRKRVTTRSVQRPHWFPVFRRYAMDAVYWAIIGTICVQIVRSAWGVRALSQKVNLRQQDRLRLETRNRMLANLVADSRTAKGEELEVRKQGYLGQGERWLVFDHSESYPLADIGEPSPSKSASAAPPPGEDTARDMETIIDDWRHDKPSAQPKTKSR